MKTSWNRDGNLPESSCFSVVSVSVSADAEEMDRPIFSVYSATILVDSSTETVLKPH